MRFHGLDLNLLVVLDALFVEQHVTRAAVRLHLTQSAVSVALGRLREHFNDPLFVLVGGAMLPTALMQSLHPRIDQVLENARGIAFANARFDPGAARRKFRIIASDYVIAVLMPALMRRLASLAPQVDLQLLTLVPLRGAEPGSLVDEALEHRHCDLVILPLAHGSARHPQFIVGGPCLSTLHSRLAHLYAQRFPLRLLPPPLAIPATLQVMQWHAYQDSDPALVWLRQLLAEVAG
ncbi:LysR family transcriptional regulator [Pseudomonas sp. LAIL14HWK12:I7]|uniref:LysR family transcriptional regulator n=1 Tax=Pseudomonas sp. LAIL14HWK12:I7 TaxID=1259801 RepID=UPI00041C2741|nr:LysR family transcriptional regulator [Pseudomonas sp. LAIL14HWK12:I7]